MTYVPPICLAFLLLFPSIANAAKPRVQHAPRMDYLDNGAIRLGVDLNLGGAVTWLSPSKSETNLINSWDWGRQIQMSYYSGPVPFTPNNKQPAPQWKALGWNPIQAGDHFGHSSKTIEHTNDGKTLYVKCVPMQWPLENEPGECTFETWYTLDGNIIKVRAALNNARSDKTQYPARTQELPAVYTNGPWHRLMTYTGDKPFEKDNLTQINHPLGKDGKPWANWNATEQWAALVDDNNFGLGVWNPDCLRFGGGFAGKPGKGGAHDDPTGYIAPNRQEILDHNIRHEFQYWLILGTLDEIRDKVYAVARRPTPPNYIFDKDRQGWWYHDLTDTGWPIKGELALTPGAKDPYLVAPGALWRAADAPILYLRAAFTTKHARAQIYFTPLGGKSIPVDFPITGDGQYRTCEIRLDAHPAYTGLIAGLRLDPVPAGAPGDTIKLRSISFDKPKDTNP